MLRLPAWISVLGMIVILSLLVGCSGGGGGNAAASVVISPGNQNGLTLQAGQAVQISPTVLQDGAPVSNPVLSWSVNGDIGAISTTGLLTATTTVSSDAPKTGSVHVAGYGQAIDIPVTVTVGPLSAMTIVPPQGVDLTHVVSGAVLNFTAEGQDSYGNRGASRFVVTPTWSVTGGIGAISADGAFTATQTGTGSVVATVGSVTTNVQVTVVTGQLSKVEIDLSVDPSSLTIGDQVTCTAVGTDDAGNRGRSRAATRIPVTADWSVQGDLGAISADGHFTAASLGTGFIVATVHAAQGDITARLPINVKFLFKGVINFIKHDVNMNLCQLGNDGSITSVTTGANDFSYPSWSTDGRYLLFSSTIGAHPGVCMMDTTTKAIQTIVSEQGRYPVMSPDGSMVAYCKGVAGTGEITLVSKTGAFIRNLAVGALGSPAHPRWSTDGKQILFCIDNSFGLANGIFAVNADGTGGATVLYHGAATDIAWSPDMKTMLATDGSTIVALTMNGTLQSTLVTENSGTITSFFMAPDGKAICYGVSNGATTQLKMRVLALAKTFTLTNISGASAEEPCWKQ